MLNIQKIGLAALIYVLSAPSFSMTAVEGADLPSPLFPVGNWWNLDISNWPVDPNSANFISFIGSTRKLHPDFGGNSGDGNGIYGMPYAVVSGAMPQDLKAVTFYYWQESDGVDPANGQGVPFYPIPAEAITQPHFVEGGDPGNIDQRNNSDRHLIIVDKDRNFLYEMWNVFYDTAQAKWFAGSGAFFDMNTNNRRPDGWTSADAAGLAILPGLVRYDEAYNDSLSEINHAFRVTVRSTNGYVYPASHKAGSTSGALPMGARLRLKASVNVAQRTSDIHAQKIFRAMQKYGLIVADNGSDMFITGTYDVRWNNDILNPAFGTLTANDFEIIQLGYNPPPPDAVLLTVVKSGTGSGTVISNSPGINCGTDCNEPYPPATKIPLTATAASGSIFTGWSGGGCSGIGTCVVTVNAATTVTAAFKKVYTLVVVKSGNGAGTVISNPTGINCGTDCNEAYAPTTKVALTATATRGSTFAGWSGGGCSGTAATCAVTLNANTTVTTTFTKPQADFVVTNIVLNPVTPAAKSTFSATVTVKNQGTLAGNGGYLDVWSNLATEPKCGLDSAVWAVVGTLNAGESKVFALTNIRAGAAGKKILRAFVDSWCETSELNEINNQFTMSYKVN